MAFKCLVCNEYKGSKQRYKGGSICKDCDKNILLSLNNKRDKRVI